MEWIRSFFVLFILLALLVYLAPDDAFGKYIRFFSEVLLTFAFLSPVLSLICDSDTFLEKIEYETFTENLAQLAEDSAKIEFLHNDYYIEKYESAIAEDVRQIAEGEGFSVESASVHLTEEYTLDQIALTINEAATDAIAVEKIYIGKTGDKADYSSLAKKLADYYQIEEERITICRI